MKLRKLLRKNWTKSGCETEEIKKMDWKTLSKLMDSIIGGLLWHLELHPDLEYYIYNKEECREDGWNILNSKWFIEMIEENFEWEVYTGYHKLDNGSSFGDIVVVVFRNFEKFCGSNVKFEVDRESGEMMVWKREKMKEI